MNKYLYNGKELQDEQLGGINLDWYDHGNRYYDPQLARWHPSDPLSELYSSSSTYAYVLNNPVNFVDPNGMYEDRGPSGDERDKINEGVTFGGWSWNPGRPQFYSGANAYFLQYLMNNAIGGGKVGTDEFNRYIMPAYAELYYYDDGENRYVSESFLNVGMQSSSSF